MYVYVCVHVSLKVRSLLLFGVLVCTSEMCGRYMYVCVCMYVRYSFIHIGGGVGWDGMDGRKEGGNGPQLFCIMRQSMYYMTFRPMWQVRCNAC